MAAILSMGRWVNMNRLIGQLSTVSKLTYHQIFNIRCSLVGNKIIDHSDVVGTSPVGAAPTTSSFLTPGFNRLHKDNCKTGRKTFKFWDLVQLILGIWQYYQTLRKLFGFYQTEEGFWPDFADIKHDYTQEFYRSYSFFISKCPRTGKFRSVCIMVLASMGFHGYPAKNIYGYWLTQNHHQNQLPLVPN